ncbi:MAG: PAS domain S-box protein [Arcobacteraceae bacterium]|jgi:PAS domain S-box-containing protein|nr:PAS domain S-box protein [Arcobacteraceae bacterium]
MGTDDVAKSSLGILKNIFHNAKVGIAVCNGKNNILEMVNPAFATIYGYESSELIGVSSSKLFSSECMMRLATLEDTQDELSFEAVHSKKDASLVYLSVYITKIKEENGVVKQYIVNIIDISEFKYQEERFTKTKAKLTAVITTIPDLIWVKDINGIYLMCNPAFERFFGASCEEIVGKTDYDFIGKEQADFFRTKDKEALEAGKMRINEEEIIFAQNGQYALLETRKIPIYFNNEFMGILGIGRNITEQNKMESEIVKQKDFQDTLLLGTAEAGVGIHVIENGRYIYTNDIQKAKKYGYDETIFDVKPNFLDTIHPDDRGKALEMYTRRMAGEDVPNSYELGVLQTDGEKREHSVSIVPIPNTNPIQTIVVTQDITERKQMELELKAREKAFSSLANNLPDNIARFDINGNYLYINSTHERTLGMHYSEVIGKHSTEIIPHHSAVLSALEQILKREQDEITVIQEFPKKNGEIETHEIKLLAEKNEKDELISVLGIGRDISEKIRVEKEFQFQKEQLFKSENMAAMGEMIGNIAHQWRQPLSVISAMTSGIAIKKELGTLKDAELISYTKRIFIQTDYLSKTIDHFTNFIKGEKEENIFNISSLFYKTLSIVDASLKANHIKFITNIDATLEIRGYENELMQAFINIINNAKDALVENETIEAKYIFLEAKSKDNQCEISIKDNGGGIQPSVMNRIFEPYFTTKHKSQGTGLGLAMTYKIITEAHKGTIIASNETYEYSGEEYTGASFTILFEKYYENNL